MIWDGWRCERVLFHSVYLGRYRGHRLKFGDGQVMMLWDVLLFCFFFGAEESGGIVSVGTHDHEFHHHFVWEVEGGGRSWSKTRLCGVVAAHSDVIKYVATIMYAACSFTTPYRCRLCSILRSTFWSDTEQRQVCLQYSVPNEGGLRVCIGTSFVQLG